MARCSHCIQILPFDAWWCPYCQHRSDYAPRGAERRRPADPVTEVGADQRFAELDPEWKAAYLARCRRRLRRRWLVVASGAASVCLFLALLVVVLLPASGSVSVPLLFGQGGPYGPSFNSPFAVNVTVGDNGAIPVVVDTGSVGLRVFVNDGLDTTAKAGVHLTSQTDSVTFADGSVWSGVVGTATVGIGGIDTTRPIPFELVRSTTCTRALPDCPAAGGLDQVEGSDAYGVLGIGMSGPEAGDPAVNPITSLPGDYGRIWSLVLTNYNGSVDTAGHLLLGDSAPAAGSSVVLHLAPLGSDAQGVPIWDDSPTMCWTIGTIRRCTPTLFDSGSDLMIVGHGTFPVRTVSMGPGLPQIVGGTVPVSLATPGGSPFYSFDSGGSPGSSAVAVLPGADGLVNSGVQAFFDLEFRYDAGNGTITIVSPPA